LLMAWPHKSWPMLLLRAAKAGKLSPFNSKLAHKEKRL
jgi:hypothetical protein